MENQELKQTVEQAVKEEIRKCHILRNKDVLLMLPDLIDALRIDREKLRSQIKRCFLSHSKDRYKAALTLFGVQIDEEKALNRFPKPGSNNNVKISIDDSYAKRWLTTNSDRLQVVVENIAHMLYELECREIQAYDEEKKRGDELFDKNEKLAREYNDLKYNTETKDRMIAERIQSMLVLDGQGGAADNEQLIELLKDMNIDVHWNCNDLPLTDAAMFNEYIVDDETMKGTKPCLVRDGAVYVKGIRFVTNVICNE